MITSIGLDLPSYYITKDLDKETFKKLKDQNNLKVIEKIYMIRNEVKPAYYFMETSPESGYYLEAKIIPTYQFIDAAKKQINECESMKGLLNTKPVYKIKADLYKEHNYEKAWSFEHFTKNKKEIYKLILDLKKYIGTYIEKKI